MTLLAPSRYTFSPICTPKPTRTVTRAGTTIARNSASRRWRWEEFVERHTTWITTLQAQGKADVSLDPELVSRALGAMVSRLAHVHLALEADTANIDDLVSISTRIWISSLKIPG